MLEYQIRALKLPAPAREFRFALDHIGGGTEIRKRLKAARLKDWRFDFAWPDFKFAAEVEGGIFVNGRHTRGAGYREDCLKYHRAMALGWTIYRCDDSLVKNGSAVQLIEQLLQGNT
jgi:hypothetical protein